MEKSEWWTVVARPGSAHPSRPMRMIPRLRQQRTRVGERPAALGEAMRLIEEEFLIKKRIEAFDMVAWAGNAGTSADSLKRARSKLL
jgi:hypothetical protein